MVVSVLLGLFFTAAIPSYAGLLLGGEVVVVDPGHGGYDPGAVRRGVREKDINLQIALKLKECLEQTGARVILTRSGDYNLAVPGLHGKDAHRYDLEKRLEEAQRSGAGIFVSIHANCVRGGYGGGAEVYYHPGPEECRLLAECVQEELRSIPGIRKRLAKTREYYVLRNANIPAVLVEVGFMDNPGERKKLTGAEYQELLSRKVACGILRFRLMRLLGYGEGGNTLAP
ncbi:MAG: N-acetylmuramoyl-L-alanine amidase [Bacillota bacterium]